MPTTARLDVFARGTVCGMRAAGATREEIAATVVKKDGSRPSLRAVDAVLAKKRAQPQWQGEGSAAGGRPPALSRSESAQLFDLVFRERGKAKVTVPYCRRRLPFLRKVREATVRRELLKAGLAYLRRRTKTAVPKEWRTKRMACCRWMLQQPAASLRKFAYDRHVR